MAQLFTSVIDKKLAALLHGGAIGILPTDTVYGLVSVIAPQPIEVYMLQNRVNRTPVRLLQRRLMI